MERDTKFVDTPLGLQLDAFSGATDTRSRQFSLLHAHTHTEEPSRRTESCESNERLNENHRARRNCRGCRKVVGSCRERGGLAIRFAKGET
jgi:hypothetical protein